MLRVTLLSRVRPRAPLAVVLTVMMLAMGLRSAHAESPASPPEGAVPAPDPAASPQPPAPLPQLQLQDEGPAQDADRADRVARTRAVTADAADERPLWKSWIFWAVTGALVAGAVGLTLYTASGSNPSLAPCPPDVQVSLGCFGAGRAQ